jgi:hypothetical protein
MPVEPILSFDSAPIPYSPVYCPAPPYNATQNVNFATNAQRAPNFPYNRGSNQSQIVGQAHATTIYNYINKANQELVSSGSTQPYKLFKTEQERIAYLQGQMAAQTRAIALTTPPPIVAPPAFPTPTAQQLCTNVFAIINNN